jgi:hypothetical protein
MLVQTKILSNMNNKTQGLVSVIIVFSLVSTVANISTPAMAQSRSYQSPSYVIKMGKTLLQPVVKGAKLMGPGRFMKALDIVEKVDKCVKAATYIKDKINELCNQDHVVTQPAPNHEIYIQYKEMPRSKKVYRICKEIKNGKYGSPFYCNELGESVSENESLKI